MGLSCFFKNCKNYSSKTGDGDVHYIPFVKPNKDLERCKRWIKLAGRDEDVSKITYNTYVCTDHFNLNEVLDWKVNLTLEPKPNWVLKNLAEKSNKTYLNKRSNHFKHF